MVKSFLSHISAGATTVIIFLSPAALAQGTAVFATSARVITPISIVKTVDMNFGNLAVSSTIPGTAILAPAGTRTTGGAGGVSLPATSGTVSAASFLVSGQPGYTYGITLPSACTLSDGASHNMVVDNFTSSPSATGLLSTAGSEMLSVGATLNVADAQPAGLYTNSAGVPVTVNYN